VHSSSEVWFIAIIALAAGAVIGYLLHRYLHPEPRRNRELQQELHDLQEQQKHYRYDVNAHFNRTTELLAQLANSYRDVHNHLASGAQDLCEPGSVKVLKPLPEHSQILEEQHPSVIEPPRDYALKSSPYDKGVLDEDFGLEKTRRDSVVEPPRVF